MTTSDIVPLLIATLGGAAVGLERQWSGHAEGPAARFAGIRTFTMLGAVGGFSGWLWTAGIMAPAAILFAGAVTIVAAGYLAASRQDIDGTTEVAALRAIRCDGSIWWRFSNRLGRHDKHRCLRETQYAVRD